MAIKKAAVVGAGNMGSGIAQKIATEGFDVLLVDTDLAKAEKGKSSIQTLLQQGVERKVFRAEQATQILSRIEPTADLERLSDVDVVIEAIFENLEVKRKLFSTLDKICRTNTIIATNTSSFLVEDLANISNPERVIGLHYFYHPAKNRLVEVIGHKNSSPDVLRRAWQFQEAIGKTPIASKDAPGFVVNRFFVPWLNEALRLHEEGINIASIEAAAKESFGVPMGPFELMNVTGVAITLHSANSLGEQLGEFYSAADIVRRQVEDGADWSLDGEVQVAKLAEIKERLLGVVFHVGTQLCSEGVCSIEDAEIGAKVGLRWPKGPFELINNLGVSEAARLSGAIEQRYGLTTPRLLKEQSLSEQPFAIARVSHQIQGKNSIVTINRPDQLNALDPETVSQLASCFEDAQSEASTELIVIRGAGKAFVAGADVKYFVDNIKSNKIDEIVKFASEGQELFRRIETSTKPVICQLDGMALGGGAELALACHRIVATSKAALGFPETNIGIYPGLGGTQRLTKKVGKGLARYLLYTNTILKPHQLQTLGLVNDVVEHGEIESAIGQAMSVQTNCDLKELEMMAKFFAENPLGNLLNGKEQFDEGLAKTLSKVRRKASNALYAVERLTELAAEQDDIQPGLREETAGLKDIFSHANALEGMTALLEGRRAEFI